MNWKLTQAATNIPVIDDYSDWQIMAPEISLITLMAELPCNNWEQIGDRVFLERDPKHRNTA